MHEIGRRLKDDGVREFNTPSVTGWLDARMTVDSISRPD